MAKEELFITYRMCRRPCEEGCKSCGYFYGVGAGVAMNGKRVSWFKVVKSGQPR